MVDVGRNNFTINSKWLYVFKKGREVDIDMGYGCVVAFANRLNLDEDGAVLQGMLDETYDGDRRMTEIATGGINKKAA